MYIQNAHIGTVLTSFVHWYIVVKPIAIWKRYTEYASMLEEMISVLYLLKTLLSPWKQILAKGKQGFFLRIIDSLVSRGIGACVRLVTIALALMLQIILLAGVMLELLYWLLFPLLLCFGTSIVLLWS